MFVDGLEVHIYNRSSTYNRLEKLFGLRTGVIDEDDDEEEEEGKNGKSEDNAATNKNR